MAFSFGPFIGFWSAYDALAARGCLLVPTGGVSTLGRLELARTSQATVVCCTPSYALHLAEVAADNKFDVAGLGVRRIIVAGEPGGSVGAVRARIEAVWNAKVIDHCGATEVGPWGYGDLTGASVSVNESEFIAEFLSVATGTPAAEGELAELVLTTLGRYGSPTIRYRTGDLVRPVWHGEGPSRFVRLDGGILGRTDDMLVVRGVNIFPSSIEQIVRSFPEVVEFRAIVYKAAHLDQLRAGSRRSAERPGANRTGTATAAGDERRGAAGAARIAAAIRREGKAVHRSKMTRLTEPAAASKGVSIVAMDVQPAKLSLTATSSLRSIGATASGGSIRSASCATLAPAPLAAKSVRSRRRCCRCSSRRKPGR